MDIKALSAKLRGVLVDKGLTLAVAESCTGGLLGGSLTSAAGSSSYFRGGIIAYDNSVKREILGVSSESLEKYGAVSAQTVREMAICAAKLFKSDCALSVSGIAGPDGGTDEKPVGLIFIGTHFHNQTKSRSFVFNGNRDDIRNQSVAAALSEFLIEITV